MKTWALRWKMLLWETIEQVADFVIFANLGVVCETKLEGVLDVGV